MKIPVYKPLLNGNEKKYVDDCLDSSWISSKGKYNDLFAEKFADYIGVEYGTTVANGTLALHLALMALGIGEGDEVIVPSFTYVASANAVKYTGADVVFADSQEDSWQLDSKDIEHRITDRTKAIMPVHLYGHPCDMDKIMEIANRYHLFVIEDCAEAIGSEYKGKKVGSFGDIAAFSFFGNKTITCGEGGMVLTNDKTLFERALHIKGQGLAAHREYWHDIIGYNYRMTNIAAAIGLAQLEQVDTFVKRKIDIANIYKTQLETLPCKVHTSVGDVKHTYWMVSILCDKIEDRDKLRDFLKKKGIETRPTFYPIHTMPMYSEKYQKLPIAEKLGWSGMNLPSFPGLKDEEVMFVCDSIKEYYRR
ncbi:DegT/DnrJ/EryC1/StrS family aminotransferase [Butyrivibrio fibrisolvens]|uniref:DegT/DnrJ/EryC1/StrS family aminotransferase n=1 Tax=Butyrivibrio fibrisolvens TaxID=831 RepID=UPI0004291B0F|nr:DegT/DnrJ/EryC1/StrS aminotransferase family protein [Butyrivibrio fibrisolvens]